MIEVARYVVTTKRNVRATQSSTAWPGIARDGHRGRERPIRSRGVSGGRSSASQEDRRGREQVAGAARQQDRADDEVEDEAERGRAPDAAGQLTTVAVSAAQSSAICTWTARRSERSVSATRSPNR